MNSIVIAESSGLRAVLMLRRACVSWSACSRGQASLDTRKYISWKGVLSSTIKAIMSQLTSQYFGTCCKYVLLTYTHGPFGALATVEPSHLRRIDAFNGHYLTVAKAKKGVALTKTGCRSIQSP